MGEGKYDFNLGRAGNRDWALPDDGHHSVPLDALDEFMDLHGDSDSNWDADTEIDAKLPRAPTETETQTPIPTRYM